jgi:hypothetical protein
MPGRRRTHALRLHQCSWGLSPRFHAGFSLGGLDGGRD